MASVQLADALARHGSNVTSASLSLRLSPPLRAAELLEVLFFSPSLSNSPLQLEYNEIRRYQSFNDLYTLYIVLKDGRESVQIYDTTSNKEELKSLAITLVDRMRLALLLPYDKQLLYEVIIQV